MDLDDEELEATRIVNGVAKESDIEEDICVNVENDNCDKMSFGECEDCIKNFFEQKATNSG